MSRVICLISLLIAFNAFGKTYVIPSTQAGCDEILEVTTQGQLSHYERVLKIKFVGAKKDKLFRLQNISQYYDSVWLDYKSNDGEELFYFWDDGYGISEGFRFRGCIYEIF